MEDEEAKSTSGGGDTSTGMSLVRIASVFSVDGTSLESNLLGVIPQDPDVLRRFLSALASDDPEFESCTLRLSRLLEERFRIYGASEDLDDAITYLRSGMELSGSESPHFPYLLCDLGYLLSARFEQSGESSDLDEALTNYHQAIELTPICFHLLPWLLHNFANSLAARFCRYGDDADLEQAVMHHRQAIELSPADHAELPSWLNSLALSLASRFIRYGDDVDLEQAITNYRQAIELVPAGHSNLPCLLNNFALSLASRFARFGKDADLEQLIVNYCGAIEITPVVHKDLPLWLNNLALSLASRFARYGEDRDLEEAITNYRQAIELTPIGHKDLPSRLSNIANSLTSRFVRYEEDADLDEALMKHCQAIELTPVDHSVLPWRLHGLAISLKSRYVRYGEVADLEQAIMNYRQAVELTPVGHIDLPSRLHNLANSLTLRFNHHGEGAGLEQAIMNYRQAIKLTPTGHSELPSFHNNLALSLASRFARYEEDADLEEASTSYRQAIKLAPADHCALPSWHSNLASSLEARYARYREDIYLNAAIAEYVKGSEATSGLIYSRLRCAGNGAVLADSSGRLVEALKAYNIAGSLLPRVIWFGQSVASRQRLLTYKPANLASDAAACAISLGFLEWAIELLDHGRSIFWSEAADIRANLIDLKNLDAGLATEFETIARALDAGAFQGQESDSPILPGQGNIGQNTEQRRRLADRLERLLLRIRKLPGFENFMQPLPFSQLRRAAAGGPIVILSVSSYRCDALIVTVDSPPKLVPLPDLSFGRVSEFGARVRKYQHGAGQDRRAFQSCLKEALRDIWHAAMSPVLSALGYTDSQEKSYSTPHVWWCPTGPLSFLPIHAAGPYTKPGGPDLLRRVVSSYMSTLSALLRARSQRRSTKSCQILLIGQPETPGQKPLLSATKELDVISDRARSRGFVDVTRLEGPNAMQDNILEKLSDATCVHFACHGHQDQTRNGLISALHVYDGPLLLPTLASRQLPHADFAFLAACHSASGSQDMPDEAMHIAAGMQVAGFRSVIATMWAMDDSTGPFVADKVYDRLFRNGPDGFDSTKAAVSLNEAVRALRKVRDENGDPEYEVDQWVPFIHIGV